MIGAGVLIYPLMPFVVSPSAPLRTGSSNHERPFDKLRANVEKNGGFLVELRLELRMASVS